MATASIQDIFGQNLKNQLKAHYLSQQEFCDDFNRQYPDTPIRRNRVSYWITGKKFPQIETRQNIADYFQKDLNWFYAAHPEDDSTNSVLSEAELKRNFASNFRYELRAHSLTQVAFQEQYNQQYTPAVSRTTVSRWALGQSMPRANTLNSIAEFLGKPASYFLESKHRTPNPAVQEEIKKAMNPEKEYFDKIHSILGDASGNYLADTNYIIAYELHSLTQAVQALQKDIDEQTNRLCEQLQQLHN